MATQHDGPEHGAGVIAIGTSAGGLRALGTVLGGLPASFPVPIVVAQHNEPDRHSRLAQLLGRRIALEVRQAEDGDQLRPGVHVAPSGHHLLVRAGGTLRLEQPDDDMDFVHPSIDLLLTSVAEAFGDRGIAVVLTGAGSDGAAGAEAVSQSGGTVVAQSAESAQFSAMPEATIATGRADLVVSLSDIGPTLLDLIGGG